MRYGGIIRLLLRVTNYATKIIIHPKRFTTHKDYDAAIVHLKDPVIETLTVKIIPITETTPNILWGLGPDSWGGVGKGAE